MSYWEIVIFSIYPKKRKIGIEEPKKQMELVVKLMLAVQSIYGDNEHARCFWLNLKKLIELVALILLGIPSALLTM